MSYIENVFSLSLMSAAACLWAGAGVETRPKYRDEQTLVGGTIWCHLIITLGLLISKLAEQLDVFVQGYYLMSGVVLLLFTGISLLFGECKSILRAKQSIVQVNLGPSPVSVTTSMPTSRRHFDKKYFSIGILALLSGAFAFTDFMILMLY